MFWFGLQEFGGCGAYLLWGQEVLDDEGGGQSGGSSSSSSSSSSSNNSGSTTTTAAAPTLPWPSDSARCTRAKSHLFSVTLLPTSETTFDVEYVLQLEIGGSIPKWLTTPVLIDTVKNLFRVAAADFASMTGGGGSSSNSNHHSARQDEQQHPNQSHEHQLLDGRELLLMAP
jgi:hypothetical protein